VTQADGTQREYQTEYETLRVEVEANVAWVTIDAPPMNVMTLTMALDLARFANAAAGDDDILVVVLQSADPDFFIAHYDVNAILEFDTTGDPVEPQRLNFFHALCEQYRTMPKATIAKIGGRVGGGGAELSASCDMRFGSLERFVLNQMEVPLGILPGGTGTQRLPRLVGRGRALEIVLGGIDVDAVTAEQWGWLNRSLPSSELDAYVAKLACRIAGFPATAIAEAKASVLAAEGDVTPGLLQEDLRFQRLLRTDAAQARMRRFAELGGQTRDAELRMEDLTAEL
jgi:enoyl-CoA hydratase/carnithine racemase